MFKKYFLLISAYLSIITILFDCSLMSSPPGITVEGPLFFSGNSNSVERQMFVGNGITFQDAATTVSFNSIFSVEGSLELNGGSLYLQRDLALTSSGVFKTGGSIYGNNHTISLPYSNQKVEFPLGDPAFSMELFMSLPPYTTSDIAYARWSNDEEYQDFTFDDTTLAFHSDFVIKGSCTFNGTCLLDGGGNILDLSSTGQIIINRDSLLSLNNLVIKGFGAQSDQFVFQDASSLLNLSNVVLEFNNNVTTTCGTVWVDGPLFLIIKDYVWMIDEQATLTIDNVVVWKDKAGASTSGTIMFANPVEEHLILLNNGKLKEFNDVAKEQETANQITFIYSNRCDCGLIIDNSDALVQLADSVNIQLMLDNSEAIVSLSENSCDYALMVDNNNALVNLTNALGSFDDTSNQLADENDHAMAQLAYSLGGIAFVNNNQSQLIRENSNAIISLVENGCDCGLALDNNNAIVHWEEMADTIITLNNQFVVENSNAIAALTENECDCRLIIENSDAIVNLVDTVAALGPINNQLMLDTSDALINLLERVENIVGINDQLIRDMSNAIVTLSENACECPLMIDNSNAIITWTRLAQNTSNAIINTSVVVSDQLVIDTSNALLSLIDCLPPCDDMIITTTTRLDKSMFIQPQQRIVVMGDVMLDGGGATIVFAASLESQFVVRSGSTLRLKNIELFNIHAATIDLQKGATLIIEKGVLFELAEDITLSQGQVIIDDTPNTLIIRSMSRRKLTLKPKSFHFAPSQVPVLLDLGSNVLTLENVDLVGLAYVAQRSSF